MEWIKSFLKGFLQGFNDIKEKEWFIYFTIFLAGLFYADIRDFVLSLFN